MKTWLKKLWCGWFHQGGVVGRDDNDEINWRCVTCERWLYPK